MKNSIRNIMLMTSAIASLMPMIAHGNPMVPLSSDEVLTGGGLAPWDLARFTLTGLLLELVIILLMTKKYGKKPQDVIKVFILLHLATWPLTCIGSILALDFLHCFSLSEIIPVLTEAAFWFWWFRKTPTPPKFLRCLWISFVANMASYVAGLIMARHVIDRL